MDLDEWEFLPDDGFLDLHEDGERKILVGKRNSDPKSIFNMNYFNVEPQPSSQTPRKVPNQLVPVPFQLEERACRAAAPESETVKEVVTRVPINVTILPSAVPEKIKDPNTGSTETDQDSVSQVFFKKTNNNEFVDMKMDSPTKSSTARGILHQIDAGSYPFEEKTEALEKVSSPRKISDTKEEEATWEENHGGLNLWKWSLTGIGAICSFGVAAATICIIVFGSQQRNKQQQQNQKLRFQIYNDDKRIKQVVHHATKLNEAISAVRGVPITRAHVTFGGYYDGL